MSDPRDASGYSASDLISMGFIHTPASPRSSSRPGPSPRSTSRASTPSSSRAVRRRCSRSRGPRLQRKFVAFYEAGKVAPRCATASRVLRYATLSSGEPLAKGKTVTGFANVEEDFADDAVWAMGALPRDRHLMPWRIEDELKRLGANFVQAGRWRGFAVRDGNLITGPAELLGRRDRALVIETLGR
jgi:hypothetical protein